MNLHIFNEKFLFEAMKSFFQELNIPVSEVTEFPADPQDIASIYYNKHNEAHSLMKNVYFLGMVNENAFAGIENTDSLDSIKAAEEDYDGLLIFGIELRERDKHLNPTRSQLAEITRLFNREFNYTPVTLIFKYGEQIAFANSERLKYKQEWREGEKVGKVSLLRDIDIENPHAGHLRILQELQIPKTGKNAVDTFAKLYNYWQEVFSVNILNKKFYNDLSNWYFWAIKHVTFPNTPTIEKVLEQTGKPDQDKLKEVIHEHNAQNVIRLLTRLLFAWFIKEKKLIPEELFDLQSLQKDVLNEISPYHEEGTMFAEANKESIYYKAILQNLFFASLNCPIKPDGTDNRTRGFRGSETYGKHRGIDWMMRYKKYFKNPEAFLNLMNGTVPFLNGGLFECLDDKTQNLYIDGFSDHMTKGEYLIVPDYLFFGVEENVDLSSDYGVNNKGTKKAAVKGLINILKSYKFTITENTPIEEDVALDPELLGKVFENLLASYNPETKTTARKQTGSFYTPREIVNYMVDESLIAYLKNIIGEKDYNDKELDEKLHQLTSFNPINPFEDDVQTTRTLVLALGEAKILDPAVGSGAFPMGMLQKMVHLLQKLDPDNQIWKEVQLEKAMAETQEAFGIEDKQEREQKLIEINNAFDKKVNDPDFARKLYLIENCIYGVDIQPIATQISKLRFFISLVVDQKVQAHEPNFGIRPLPNLETRFVTANTLIGIKKPDAQISMFETDEVKNLETELKQIRHKLFNARTKETKLKYRQKDEELRFKIADILKDQGLPLDDAEKLAKWDPYDQNASSPFFDPEWMFDINDGFDVVIGNPPYRPIQKYEKEIKEAWSKQNYSVFANSGNIYFLFFERANKFCTTGGITNLITSNQWMRNKSGEPLRKFFLEKTNPQCLVDFRGTDIFDNVAVLSSIMMTLKRKVKKISLKACDISTIQNHYTNLDTIVDANAIFLENLNNDSWLIFDKYKYKLREEVIAKGKSIFSWGIDINYGIKTGFNDAFYLSKEEKDKLIAEDPKNTEIIKPMLRGKDLAKYFPLEVQNWLIFTRRGINIDEYPTIKSYLEKFYEELKPKTNSKDKKGRKPGNYGWYEIQDTISYHKQFIKPKLIFMNMSKDLIFSFDPNGEFYTNQKCFIATGDNIKYLTAFFNSRLFYYFFKDNFPELLGDVREVSKVYFEKIPVIEPIKKHSCLIETLVDIVVHSRAVLLKADSLIETVIDGLFNELYFSDHMQERGIDVMKFVERDINAVMQKREFETLSDTEKENVIELLHKTWTNPENEVVKRMAMFKEKSPDILRPILES